MRDRSDGRFGNASARSFHPGDTIDMRITGTSFRVYGITGPTGGHAIVLVGGQPVNTIDFYSRTKHTHVLLYRSPWLPPGTHEASILVSSLHDPASRGTYVNIDVVDVVP